MPHPTSRTFFGSCTDRCAAWQQGHFKLISNPGRRAGVASEMAGTMHPGHVFGRPPTCMLQQADTTHASTLGQVPPQHRETRPTHTHPGLKHCLSPPPLLSTQATYPPTTTHTLPPHTCAPDHFSISSTKSYLAWMKSFFLYPRRRSSSL